MPIIATDVGSIPDMLHNEKNGFLIPIKSSECLYTKMNFS